MELKDGSVHYKRPWRKYFDPNVIKQTAKGDLTSTFMSILKFSVTLNATGVKRIPVNRSAWPAFYFMTRVAGCDREVLKFSTSFFVFKP